MADLPLSSSSASLNLSPIASDKENGEDMREFLNAANGPSKQSLTANERSDSDTSRSPLVGRTDVFDLPFHMARDQIEESLRNKMSSIKEIREASIH